jgi:hypothetical protein
LQGFLIENRRLLVVAALTILRAYEIAGRPRQSVSAWGGFEDWSASIREPLIWLDLPDPLETREFLVGVDPEREVAATLFKAWYSALPEERKTLREVWEATKRDDGLRVALYAVIREQQGSGPPDLPRFGYWCRSWRSRVLDGLRLCTDDKRTKSGSRWWIEKVAG